MGHHHHQHGAPEDKGPELDLSVPDSDLDPQQLARRSFLRRAGIIGAGVATASVLPAGVEAAAAGSPARGASPAPRGGYTWLAGDHHIHTQYSPDGRYRVADQVQHAAAYGLDWMVITDHGSETHAKIGVELVNPEIRAARKQDDMLVFQGLEWNIPAAEHGTVFVHPGKHEVSVLKHFEQTFDGVVTGTTASTPANESRALRGLEYLATVVKKGRVEDALMLANHPARKGIDSPHEIRGWRDQAPTIAVGMEGAPGHQAAGIPEPYGPGAGRGYYDSSLHQPHLGDPVLNRDGDAVSCVVGQWRTTQEAEHGWSQTSVGPDSQYAATVFVPPAIFGRAEVAVVTAADAGSLPEGARLFCFPGDDGLPAEPTVAQLLAGTAVEEVVALGHVAVPGDRVVRTEGFLRPLVTSGRVRLLVRPGADSRLLPFEQPNPTPCCLDH